MRPEMRPQVRAEDLAAAAGSWLLEVYAGLAQRREHLFARLLDGHAPRQWQHYPDSDAIDNATGFQWFYHSHSPEDRPGTAEHGHIHLFARRRLWSRRLASMREREFAGLAGGAATAANTRHLLAIGFNAKGVPASVFTVNSWVTGDAMLSAATTLALLQKLTLDTGHEEVDAVIEGVVALCNDEIARLLEKRDRCLFGRRSPGVLRDPSLEVLSEFPIDIDAKLAARPRGGRQTSGRFRSAGPTRAR
jgi:hypothetical protein